MYLQGIFILMLLFCGIAQGFPQKKQQGLMKIAKKMMQGKNFMVNPNEDSTNLVSNQNKLKLEIYSEVLCPDCQQFIMGSFQKALKINQFLNYVDIQMYFYGNAEEKLDEKTQKFSYKCQHGMKECEGNRISNCIVSKSASQKQALDLIVCFEQEIKRYAQPAMIQFDKILQKCFKNKIIDEIVLQNIIKCNKDEEGDNLQHIAALKTQKQTDIQYVPWILVEGKHNESKQKAIVADLVQYTCDYFKLKNISPPFCSHKKPSK